MDGAVVIFPSTFYLNKVAVFILFFFFFLVPEKNFLFTFKLLKSFLKVSTKLDVNIASHEYLTVGKCRQPTKKIGLEYAPPTKTV